jgi:type II secretory ATPase GspE/PulE/Tfp pilus assembly ATPase PilB-like protein/nucleotide-binding universal stress UspA family protein
MSLPKNILVPTDFSTNSVQALHYACDLAREAASTLHLVHVGKNQLDSRAKETALNRIANSIDAESELEIRTLHKVLYGAPPDAIAKYARENEIDLVVMGTQGRTGLAHLAMGSVAEGVLRKAPCPVTVIGPHDGENASFSDAMEVLSELLGDDDLSSQKDIGHIEMADELMERLRIPSTSAILMVSELEYRGWILWEDEKWKAIEGPEFVVDEKPFTVNLKPESQAVELIKRARKLRATDIHIDPIRDTETLVRLRIDGQLHEYCRLDHSVGEHLINQYKTMARVDIPDPFRPQEGRLRLPETQNDIEVRLSTVPVISGESIALRILDPQDVMRPLNELGLMESELVNVREMLNSQEGLVLVIGPTGSGKTTTVYSMLETLGGKNRNIVSIEDPVEFTAPFVRQVSVDPKHGLTMESGLRTLLRMDPDVLFLGEIRDLEAADIALRAAASGKYVFSTLHTRDIASTVSAMADFGLKQSSIAANLTGIINQRLVRRLCCECKQATEVPRSAAGVFKELDMPVPDVLFEPVGCPACRGRGYRGRVGIFETCAVNGALREVFATSSSKDQLAESIKSAGHRTLRQDAMAKLSLGQIDLLEANSIRWLG